MQEFTPDFQHLISEHIQAHTYALIGDGTFLYTAGLTSEGLFDLVSSPDEKFDESHGDVESRLIDLANRQLRSGIPFSAGDVMHDNQGKLVKFDAFPTKFTSLFHEAVKMAKPHPHVHMLAVTVAE